MGKTNTFLKLLLGIVISLLIVGAVLLLLFYLNAPQGIYLVYNGKSYGNSPIGASNGITLSYDTTAEFTIENSDDWGVYSVQDCVVKIVPNVDDTHDFVFTVAGENSYLYSSETDLTAAFSSDYDSDGVNISADGTFSLSTEYATVADVLSAVYGETVTMENTCYLDEYPYIAISVVSPDGASVLNFPLRYEQIGFTIKLDKDGIVF